MGVRRTVVEIRAPGDAIVRTESVELPSHGEVLVTAEWGAISPGSESLVYAGGVPDDMTLDDSIGALSGGVTYPLRYGYTLAGRVSHCGEGVDVETWLGRRVFAFHPHASHAVVPVDEIFPIPDGLATDAAPLYANTETAVTLVWDGRIALGETVLVLGLGIVGQLVAALAARSGAGRVVAVDPDAARREAASHFLVGSGVSIAAAESEIEEHLTAYAGRPNGAYTGFDVVFELTGNPKVLNEAIGNAAFGGRVIVGSWYGTKSAPPALGGRFHRARIQIISSQVSTIPLAMRGHVDHKRRMAITWELLRALPVDTLVRDVVSLGSIPSVLQQIAAGARYAPWIAVDYRGEEEEV